MSTSITHYLVSISGAIRAIRDEFGYYYAALLQSLSIADLAIVLIVRRR